MINRDVEDEKTVSEEAEKSEDRIDLFSSEEKNKLLEEVKQEESSEQAQREGNMNFIGGECGGSQCTLQMPFSQSMLIKRA